MPNPKTMYLDDKEVKSVSEGVVTFTDGTTQEYSKEWAEYLVTDEVKKDFRFHKIARLAGKVLKELVDGKFDSYEQEYLLDTIQQSITKANEEDLCKRYGVTDPRKVTFDQVSKNLAN